MSIRTYAIFTFALAACTAGAAFFTAHAADNSRYISINGKNSNPCTLAAPCRSLQRGIDATPPRGELNILDSGDYGNRALIKKSLTISGNGHTIYLGTTLGISKPKIVVTLRGLVLNGRRAVANAVAIKRAGVVRIERCVIHDYTGHAIDATAEDVVLFVTNSTMRDNGGAGLYVQTSTGASRVTVDNSRIENNVSDSGLLILSGTTTVSRSIIARNFHGIAAALNASVEVTSTRSVHNSNAGFFVSNANTSMTVESSAAHGNMTGLDVVGGATARISHSTFTGNVTGISNNASILESFQNNTVWGNTINRLGGVTQIDPT